MNRRGFLSLLSAASIGATLDPERLLWVPGSKTIFIPNPIPIVRVTYDDNGLTALDDWPSGDRVLLKMQIPGGWKHFASIKPMNDWGF